MKKNEATKNEMPTTMLRTALVSVWAKAHAFEEMFREWNDDSDHEIVDEFAEELVREWEMIADDLAPLFNHKTVVEFGKKLGGDYAMLALYCHSWQEKAVDMLLAEEEEA